jgi:predicted MPP superfamily phosphohydrolase
MIEEMDDYRCDLMLSGHTHGGQIFPFGLLVMTAQPYLAGLHQHSPDRQIFVSRGTGYWGPPLRVLAPSEISQILIEPA